MLGTEQRIHSNLLLRVLSSKVQLRFESLINTRGSFGCLSQPLSTFRVRYTRVPQQPSRRSERAIQAQLSHSYCILRPYIVHGQTGLVALEFRAANNFAKELSEKEGIFIYSRWQLQQNSTLTEQLCDSCSEQ